MIVPQKIIKDSESEIGETQQKFSRPNTTIFEIPA